MWADWIAANLPAIGAVVAIATAISCAIVRAWQEGQS